MRLFKIGRHLLLQPGHGQLPIALPVGKRVSYFILARTSFWFSRPSPKPETQWPHYTLPFLLLLPLHQLINKSCNSPSWGGHVQYLSFQPLILLASFRKTPSPHPNDLPKALLIRHFLSASGRQQNNGMTKMRRKKRMHKFRGYLLPQYHLRGTGR